MDTVCKGMTFDSPAYTDSNSEKGKLVPIRVGGKKGVSEYQFIFERGVPEVPRV